MNIVSIQNGSQIASKPHESAADCAYTSPTTLSELLGILESDSPKSLPMLRSAVVKIAEFQNQRTEEISLDRVFEMRSPLRRYLKSRTYTENSIRTYVNLVSTLIQKARAAGWRPYQTLSEEWQQILAVAPKNKCTDIVRSLALLRKSPREVTSDDVDAWCENALGRGLRSIKVNRKRGAFWRLLRECGMTDYKPLSAIRAQVYKVPFEQLPQQLRMDVEQLIKWKTAEFQLGRLRGEQIRAVTANGIIEKVCQLFGYAVNVRGLSGIESLLQLAQLDFVSDYVSWCINERGVKGVTLRTHLGRLDVAMRQHPSYKSLDLSWFKPLLESLPVEPESERRMRKAKKYLEYSDMEAIPAKIHAERLPATGSRKPAEVLAMEELLFRWLLALPWRQLNIRECRIRGARPNIFKDRIPTHIPMDVPAWVRAEEQRNSEAVFWQMHFMPKETKTGREIHAVVPRPLIKPLEEYLAKFRPRLLKNGDPGTLFISRDGTSMTPHQVYYLVTSITSRHGGRSVNPHLFRDIVAFAWLKAHPKDYLTLSKILWHANINYTIKVYGSQFDESSGVCAMESWLEEREAKGK